MPTDPTAAWAWLIRGLGGVVRMLERELDEAMPCTKHWKAELAELIKRLQMVYLRLP